MTTSRARRIELAIVVALLVAGAAVRLRICWDWQFAGSDSYGYVALANELHANGRIALSPKEGLAWWRPPLYPIFIAAVKRGERAEMSGGPGWKWIEAGQGLFDLFGTGLLVWALARRLGGRAAGLVALGLVMLFPPTVIFVAAALTESLAMFLTVATVAPLVLLRDRPRLALALFGLGVGLSLLLRADGILLAIAAAPFLWRLPSWRARATGAGVALAAFLVAVGPWAARNLVHFGSPHLLGAHLDRTNHPMPHHAGFWRWLTSWARDWAPLGYRQACFYDPRCPVSVNDFAADGAFADLDDRATVDALLKQRAREGISEGVSRGFSALADARLRHAPLRVLLAWPLTRAAAMWIARHDEILQSPTWRPWKSVVPKLMPLFLPLVALLVGTTLLGAIVLLGRAAPTEVRVAALILFLPIVARTLVLPFFGYAMPRYAVEAMPLCFVIAAAGVAGLAARLREARR
jgi:4-amino-4-deoxy-L-arabinose transferase-like glycosyltransferase